MLDRLKSLPLTILLTILIWMYAEAQFTSTQPEVPITVRVVSSSPEYAVRTMDPVDKRYTNLLNFTVTLQGPKNQIDQIYQESQGMRENIEGDKLAALTFVPTNDQLRAATANGGNLTPNILQMLNNMEYFRSRGVTVTFASPGNATVEVDRVKRLHKTAEFQSALAVESWTIDPPEVDVQLPEDALPAMGGPDAGKLKVHAVPVNEEELAAMTPGTPGNVAVRFIAEYPGGRDDRIRVIPAQGNASVSIRSAPQSSLTVNLVPIWVSGPPELLARFDVDVTPKTVDIKLAGPASLLDALRQRIPGGPSNAGVFAYLDVTPDDKPAPGGASARHAIRFVFPEGLTLLQSAREAEFRLTEKPVPAPAPASQAGPPR